MKRNVDLRNISDGRLYTSNDMVKADCQDCKGCSACCKGMGESIILDPMDVFRLQQGTGMKFQEMLENYVSLQVVDGIVLPHLKMNQEGEGCAFLNEEGRCSIHPFRPGICRLFPLGRVYDEEGFHYFLQIHECKKKDRTKIKVKNRCFCRTTPEIVDNLVDKVENFYGCPCLHNNIFILPKFGISRQNFLLTKGF